MPYKDPLEKKRNTQHHYAMHAADYKARAYLRRKTKLKNEPAYVLEWRAKRKIYDAARFQKFKHDPLYRLKANLRRRLHHVLVDKCKVGSAVRDLGCDGEFLIRYIELKWQPGWSWDNYGTTWVIDHIKPLSSFDLTNREQFLKAVHYTNLQPLDKIENLIKGRTIPGKG